MGAPIRLLTAVSVVVLALLVRVRDCDAALDGEGVLATVLSIVALVSGGGLIRAGHGVNSVELIRDLLVLGSLEGVRATCGLSGDTS